MNNLHDMFILTKYLLKKKHGKWEISNKLAEVFLLLDIFYNL